MTYHQILAALLGSAVIALSPQAQAQGGPPVIVTQPDWLETPTSEDFDAVYPLAARQNDIEGGARLRCEALTTGALVGCEVVSEQPEGLGFGEAALLITPKFRMAPGTRDGTPVTSTVHIPIVFKLESDVPPADPEPAREGGGFPFWLIVAGIVVIFILRGGRKTRQRWSPLWQAIRAQSQAKAAEDPKPLKPGEHRPERLAPAPPLHMPGHPMVEKPSLRDGGLMTFGGGVFLVAGALMLAFRQGSAAEIGMGVVLFIIGALGLLSGKMTGDRD